MKLTQPLISWVSKALFIEVKPSMNKSTHSRPRGVENMNAERYTATCPFVCFNGAVFKKMDNFHLRSTGQNKRDKYPIIAVLLNGTAFALTEEKRSFGEKCCFCHITLVEEGS